MLDFEGLRTGAGIFDVLSRAQTLERQGKRVLHFEIGQPDFCTPECVKDVAKKALDENFTGYVSAQGILELKEAIQDEIEKTRGFCPLLNQILVVPGGNSAIFYMIRAASDNPLKEEVIHPNPGFPTYRAVVHYLNTGNISLPLKEENEFRLNPADVEEKISPKTKVIVLNSPQNPTGSVMKKEEIIRIAELAEENNVYLLSDEIYSKMTYDETFYSCSEHDECKERTVILDGFSKAYSMTGWRLGYVIGPERIIDRMGLLISMTVSCVNAFIQKAGAAALTMKEPQEELKRNMKAFRKRRDAIVDGLNSISGFSCLRPQGAFYVFPNIKDTGKTSKELADKLLEENGVACLPGTVFGDVGEGYLRFSYATSVDNINEAIESIKDSF
ncbi:MAG: pyridoxal phosphate-dependent aminotransferase [Candidatus Heimdallarchaeota archaeon]|nr:MAG: pyridoxal phosphate-dependent aminotransferase [Candidatus Heimdallarchaeota archaeon]